MARPAETIFTPTRDDFAAMLEESYIERSPAEGAVVKGVIVAVENDFVVVDVGLKTEGRVPVKEFSAPGQNATIKVGDEVEVYVERVENALGEAVLSRDKARREESWTRLEKAFQDSGRVSGVIFGRVKGGFTVDLDGAVAFLPGSQVDVRPVRDVGPLMNMPQPFQILKMDRRRGNIVVSRRTVLEESRAEQRHEIVANLIRAATRWTEKRKDSKGRVYEYVHEPEAWAIKEVWDRAEGKPAQALTIDSTREGQTNISLIERVIVYPKGHPDAHDDDDKVLDLKLVNP